MNKLEGKRKSFKSFEFYNYNSPMLVINIMSSFGQLDKKITNQSGETRYSIYTSIGKFF